MSMSGNHRAMRQPSGIEITVPSWAWDVSASVPLLTTADARMGFLLDLVDRNVAEGGGPFAAAIFDREGRIIAPGVNRVVPDNAPIAHAEIVAIAMAGQRSGTWDLGATGELELVSSTEPCAMCLGAIPWAGVTSLVCGARDEDARAIGFDEGAKPDQWVDELAARGISVTRDVRRAEAAAALRSYREQNGDIYNGDTLVQDTTADGPTGDQH